MNYENSRKPNRANSCKACHPASGFTLIELMIAVAIIGVLSSIAIANYTSYQSRARQSEAKIALATIYTLETAFYQEYSAYIDDFSAIGYTPEGLKRHYTIGWRTPTDASIVTGYIGGIDIYFYDYVNIPVSWGTDSSGSSQCDITNARSGLSAARTGTNVNPQTFEVRARGVLSNGKACDEWIMIEGKVLRNTVINL